MTCTGSNSNVSKVCCANCEGSVLEPDKDGNIRRVCWNRDSDKWYQAVNDTDQCLDFEEKETI